MLCFIDSWTSMLCLIDSWTSMLCLIDSCQSKVPADQYHVTTLQAQVKNSWRVTCFLKLTADWAMGFLNDRRLKPSYITLRGRVGEAMQWQYFGKTWTLTRKIVKPHVKQSHAHYWSFFQFLILGDKFSFHLWLIFVIRSSAFWAWLNLYIVNAFL